MSGARLGMAVALAVAALLAPTLAHTPQSGDGAEIVTAALQGGVLHPPGFPLQAWLDRVLVRLPLEPARAIALLGLISHAAAAGLLAATLRALGSGITGALAAAAAFAFFPSVWRVAVEPEVFAPAIAAAAVALRVSAAALARGRGAARAPGEDRGAAAASAPSFARAAGIGLLIGLGAATHPIVLTAVPLMAVAALRTLAGDARRGARIAALAAAALIPFLALYFSLPLLRTASPWPDWGALATPADVLRHVSRVEYGSFSFSAAEGEQAMSALAVWGGQIARVWNVALVLVAAGLWSFARRSDAPGRWAVAGAGALALGVLALGRLPEQSYSVAYLEKLQGPATLIAALLLGLGVDAARRAAPAAARRGLDALVALAAAAWLVTGWPAANASADRTLALHQEGVALELGDSTVYVTEGDVESFMGATAGGARRFPLLGPEMAFEWYWRDVAPRLEPRVLAGQPIPSSWRELVERSLDRGLEVAGTSHMLVAVGGYPPELRGLLFAARRDRAGGFGRATVEAALRLTPVAARLPALPPGRREFSRFYARRFARAWAGAAQALDTAGLSAAAASARAVEQSILRGDPPAARAPLLAAFETECRAAGIR